MSKALFTTCTVLLLSACGQTQPTPVDDTYYRLQLKSSGMYLDSDHCTTTLALNPGSTYAGGPASCGNWCPQQTGTPGCS